ncbi:MAG: acyl-CoA dehydrogenase [Candidatus Zixiibacteriota bacterium]|nr:MAG: acyl-CoA dehydrogenase [candidate division Zixibacteria bacterium]
MSDFLTEYQDELRRLARRIAEEKVRPRAAHCDRTGEFPWDLIKTFAEAGFYGVYIDEQYGGSGGGVMELCLVTEELSRACGGISLAVAATALGAFPIILSGTDEQKQRWLPAISRGEMLTAFCLTEPEAGSDASNMKTTAKADGDYYVLNGLKHFITNAGVAKLYTVIASTDASKGIMGTSAFVVEEGTPGLFMGKEEDKLGIRASQTREVVFENCRVPKANLLGSTGRGFITAMKTLDRSRPGVAAQALGIAQGAFDLAVDYVKKRKQFGQAIADFQGVQWMLADMATEIESARALLYKAARLIDSGASDVSKLSAMSKLKCSDVAMRVTTDALQLFGGYGYMKDYPIEKYLRDAKITQIYEGTNQIQRVVIAKNLLKEAQQKM